MKELKLKVEKESILIDGEYKEAEIKATNIIRNIISQPKEGGYSIEDMRIRLNLLDLIDQADKYKVDYTYIKDEELSYLKDLSKTSRWSALSRTVLNFIDELDKL